MIYTERFLSQLLFIHLLLQSHFANAFLTGKRVWNEQHQQQHHPHVVRFLSNSHFDPITKSLLSNKQRTMVTKTKMQAMSSSLDDDLKKQLEKAKALLEKTKAKQAEKAADSVHSSTSNINNMDVNKQKKMESQDEKRNRVVKTKSEGTGLITTDGDLMALLSEDEEWELKSLEDVFENEIEVDDHNGLANRDVAASIFNLRMTLQNEDYKAIFDSRNRFIGEND